MKILNKMWFTNRDGTTGIIRVETDFREIKYYIGRCSGNDEEQDAVYICDWGRAFPNKMGDALFGV